MAPSKQILCFLFLALLSSSLQVHARDSQFFSKVTKKTEVVQVPAKTEQQSQSPKTEQEPNFIPDNQNGYGLFGHESGQLPPSTTTTATTPSGETFTNKEAYVTNSQGMSDTKFMDRGYTNPTEEAAATTTTSNLPYRGESGEPFSNSNANNYYNNEADSQGVDKGYTTTSGEPFSNSKNYYNNEAYVTGRQGMSDTRFMDRGYTTTSAANTDNNNYYYNNDGTVIDPEGYTPAAINNNEFVTNPQGVSGRAHTTSTNNQFSGPTKFMDAGYTTTTSGEPFTNSKNYNNDAYVTGQQGMSDTRFMDRGYTTPTTTTSAANTDNNYYYYNKDGTVIDPQGYTTASVNNNNYNEFGVDPQGVSGRAHTTSTNNQFSGPTKFMDAGYTTAAATTTTNSATQRQGMSDTRFMENGKYYYDPMSENKYNFANGYENSRGAEYNTQGYYGKDTFDQYKNSNSMEGYQNQQEFQEEDPQEFEP